MIFDTKSDAEYRIAPLQNESKLFHGKIIKWSQELSVNQPIKNLLLAGEPNTVKNKINASIKGDYVYTAGLEDVDFIWDFENDPNIDIKFDLIISQAVIEHLINPYKHISDLVSLLTEKGLLIIHTVEPGFRYHKHPIDVLRYYPDWFEAIALKLNLFVCRRGKIKYHIFYMFKNMNYTK